MSKLLVQVSTCYFTLNLINVVWHSFGIYIMFIVCNQGPRTSQSILILNLCSSHLFLNFFKLFSHITNHSDLNYVFNLYASGINYVYLWILIYILGERLLLFALNGNYPVYCIYIKTITFITWMISLKLALAFPLIYHFYTIDKIVFLNTTELYFPAVFYVCYVFFVVISYSIIFYKYASIRKNENATLVNTDSSIQPFRYIFHDSRFLTPFLLVTTSISLIVVPKLFFLYNESTTMKIIPLTTELTINICRNLSNMCDGIVYLFFYRPARKVILSKLSFLLTFFKCNDNDTSVQIESAAVLISTRV